jgi:hypothetical protein
MSRFKKFTFRDKRSIKHQVNGQEFRFYPNRVGLLTEARDLAEPVAQAINTLFADQTKDTASNVKRQHEGDFFLEDIETQGISIEMAKHRQTERSKAISTILGTLADARSLILLGKLFMDSLRDEFEYKRERSAQEVEEFLYGDGEEYEGLDAPMLVEMFRGWMKANATTFGDAGESLVGLVRAKIDGLVADSGQGSEKPDPTSGEPCKTPSSPQSASASTPTT